MTHDEDLAEDEHLQDIEELKNLEIQLDGGVIGKDFREIILRQMKLTTLYLKDSMRILPRCIIA